MTQDNTPPPLDRFQSSVAPVHERLIPKANDTFSDSSRRCLSNGILFCHLHAAFRVREAMGVVLPWRHPWNPQAIPQKGITCRISLRVIMRHVVVVVVVVVVVFVEPCTLQTSRRLQHAHKSGCEACGAIPKSSSIHRASSFRVRFQERGEEKGFLLHCRRKKVVDRSCLAAAAPRLFRCVARKMIDLGVQQLRGEVAVGPAGLHHPRAVPEGTPGRREGGQPQDLRQRGDQVCVCVCVCVCVVDAAVSCHSSSPVGPEDDGRNAYVHWRWQYIASETRQSLSF